MWRQRLGGSGGVAAALPRACLRHACLQSEAATQAQQPWRWSAGRRSAPRRGSRAAARAAAEAPAVHPARLRLGADIPIALKPVTVAGCTFLLVVPDIDAGAPLCA